MTTNGKNRDLMVPVGDLRKTISQLVDETDHQEHAAVLLTALAEFESTESLDLYDFGFLGSEAFLLEHERRHLGASDWSWSGIAPSLLPRVYEAASGYVGTVEDLRSWALGTARLLILATPAVGASETAPALALLGAVCLSAAALESLGGKKRAARELGQRQPFGARDASQPEDQAVPDTSASPPRVFVSYAWESIDYRLWVAGLAGRLWEEGIEARLDRWHLEEGLTVAEFMSREVRVADRVLILCSPSYRRKVHLMEEGGPVSGLGWEHMLVTSQAFATGSRSKLIPALTLGCWTDAAPDALIGLPYSDLSHAETFDAAFQELVARLWGWRPLPPPLGSPTIPAEPTAIGLVQRPFAPDHVDKESAIRVPPASMRNPLSGPTGCDGCRPARRPERG